MARAELPVGVGSAALGGGAWPVARFDDAQTYRTFLRLESEPSFSDKHPRLFRLGRLLRRLRLLSLLRHLPPTWMTPMQVTFCHPDAV